MRDQLPDRLAAVTVNGTGLLDLNGFSDAIGSADGQVAQTVTGGVAQTGAGALTVNGDIVTNGAFGVGTLPGTNNAVVAPVISGKLNLGSGYARTLTINDRPELLVDAVITADLSGTADVFKAGAGNRTGLSVTAGELWAYGGDRTLTNSLQIAGSCALGGRRDAAAIGDTSLLAGVDDPFDLTFAPTMRGSINTGTPTLTVNDPNARVATDGNLGENAALTAGNQLLKGGFGHLTRGGSNVYTGLTTINAGTIRVAGTWTGTAGPRWSPGRGTAGRPCACATTRRGHPRWPRSSPSRRTRCGRPGCG